MVLRELKKEDGYTVAELLIALTIVSIVLALASSVFIFVSQQMNTWKANMYFYNTYQVAQNKLFNDILSAESMSSTDTSLTITNRLGSTDRYSWGSGQTLLNENKLSISEVDSLILQLNNDPLSPKLYQWSMRQRVGNKVLDQTFVLHLRKPILWEPLQRTNLRGF